MQEVLIQEINSAKRIAQFGTGLVEIGIGILVSCLINISRLNWKIYSIPLFMLAGIIITCVGIAVVLPKLGVIKSNEAMLARVRHEPIQGESLRSIFLWVVGIGSLFGTIIGLLLKLVPTGLLEFVISGVVLLFLFFVLKSTLLARSDW